MEVNKSHQAFDRARKLIPGGVNSPVRSFKSIGGTPPFIAGGRGSTITDLDGNSYIDYCTSWGALIHGHANPFIIKAAKNAIDLGTSFGCPTEAESDLAKLVCDAVPSIEMVRFVNSGTEAVMSAVRLARAFTGRNRIVKFDGCYHGHADHLLISAGSGLATNSIASSDGIPPGFVDHTTSVPYNNPDALEEVFKEYGDDIAAVIIEPIAANMGIIPPDEGFLKMLRDLCSKNESVLIFDEVITGFRIDYGGAQTHYSVQPDLTTLGKIIGGGFPVGAFGGKKEIMSLLAPEGRVYQAGTLSGNPVAMSAGIAALTQLKQNNFYKELQEKSEYLQSELRNGLSGHEIQIHFVGSMFTLFFTGSPVRNFTDVHRTNQDKFRTFYKNLLKRGIYLSPSPYEANFISSAHTSEDLNYTSSTIVEVLHDLDGVF